MRPTLRTAVIALMGALLLMMGAAAVAPVAASAFPVADFAQRHDPAVVLAAASADADEDGLTEDERAYGPYGGLVSLPALFLMWWMRRQVRLFIRRLLGHGFRRMMGDITLESPKRAANPAGGGLFGKSTPSPLEERMQRLKPEFDVSPFDPSPQPVAAPISAYAGERGFGRRGVR